MLQILIKSDVCLVRVASENSQISLRRVMTVREVEIKNIRSGAAGRRNWSADWQATEMEKRT